MTTEDPEIKFPPLPKTKAELLERIAHWRKALEEAISQLSDNQIEVRRIHDGWTVKDILAHLAVWEQIMLQHHIGGRPFHEVAGRHGAPPRMTGIDGLNEHFWRRYRTRTLKEILAFFHDSHRQVLEALQELDEADLFSAGDPDRQPLINYVAGNTYEHIMEHMPAINSVTGPGK